MLDLSVYLHFPWCLRKCPYCDFATTAREREAIPHQAYADAVIRELEQRASQLTDARLYSVFFGGGTPSLWQPRELGRVLARVRSAFVHQAAEVEVTVECNPSSLDFAHAAALREAGVNRLSVGVQSLDNDELKFLGRLHDRALALSALDAAQASFERVSADLMFALPGQSAERFYGYIDTFLQRGLSHVSAYALTIEPATKFGADARAGLLQAAPDEAYAVMFEGVEQRFGAAGLGHYEVSNYARNGEESRHNQHYWRGGAYLGLGAAAVGCLARGHGGRRYRNHPDAGRYMERAATPAVEVFEEQLAPGDVINEALMLGLRTSEGVNLTRLAERTGLDPLATKQRAVQRRIARGELTLDGDVLRVPSRRWLLLDGIVADLF
ncbi:MAG: Radical family enzyme similar to coproporphyrinogen oxidase [Myxococcaceae bacterium]|nr:Radical family enzyme similar to coproporphyrinogen oxidase [Myxococcaceae bacterium]